jgi:hypothetical protein
MEVSVVEQNERARLGPANRMLVRESHWIIDEGKLIVLASPSPDDVACLTVYFRDLIRVSA